MHKGNTTMKTKTHFNTKVTHTAQFHGPLDKSFTKQACTESPNVQLCSNILVFKLSRYRIKYKATCMCVFPHLCLCFMITFSLSISHKHKGTRVKFVSVWVCGGDWGCTFRLAHSKVVAAFYVWDKSLHRTVWVPLCLLKPSKENEM